MISLVFAFVLASSQLSALTGGESALSKDASARELVESCRAMIPADVEISGRIVLRSRKGIVRAA